MFAFLPIFHALKALAILGVSQQPLGQMSQIQGLWTSDTPKEGILFEEKTRGAPLTDVCLRQLNGDSTLP